MNDDSKPYQVRAQGWGKTKTLDILTKIQKFRDDAREAAGKTYPTVLMADELAVLKAGSTPEMSDWWDANSVVIEIMNPDNTLQEMIGGKREITKEAPALNRADRRRLRHTKAR
jgi:hypothetical protein